MDDLISRAALFNSLRKFKYDIMHDENPAQRRVPDWNDAVSLVGSEPVVDAIPVNWLEDMLDKTAVTDVDLNNAIFHVLCAWEREKQKEGENG